MRTEARQFTEEDFKPSTSARVALYNRYADRIVVNSDLDRSLISFQANKQAPLYRWFKYKEAFSSEFVRCFLKKFKLLCPNPKVLDPFSGAGTTLTVASEAGWQATGIELLPIGAILVRARLLASAVNIPDFQDSLKRLRTVSLVNPVPESYHFKHIRITEKAFPKETERAIGAYSGFLEEISNPDVRYLFWFACLSILEEVSYTSKDGQFLRWDARSGKCFRSKLNKGTLPDLKTALIRKLEIMLEDIKNREEKSLANEVRIIESSCLTELPKLPDGYFNLIITSPPYCNRYDYSRTYALELAFLGFDEDAVKNLRQTLLSATVENKTKRELLSNEYRRRNQEARYEVAIETFYNQAALHEVLNILYEARAEGKLNNNNIPIMVENYFFEMNLVIHELSRVLAPGGYFIMVNDNVQYYGEEVPVDLILSDFAVSNGLSIENIWVLPRGKGNSSQQMGVHGRNEIRKCVYVWSKPRKEGGLKSS